jgi:hypothetical protein
MHRLIGSVTSQEPVGHCEVVPSRTRGPTPKRPEADAPVPFRRGCAPRVEGKFQSPGGRRLRVQEMIYGPFSPGDDGNPFPGPARGTLQRKSAVGRSTPPAEAVPTPLVWPTLAP